MSETPETVGYFLDPFWLKHAERIRAIRNVIESPKTRPGEEIQISALNNPVFVVYSRLHPILFSLIALTEYDEIGKAEKKNYFSGTLNQRMVLRAVKLLVEDVIKFPYSEEEIKKYNDYRQFFTGVLGRLVIVDKQIQTGQKPPNFVNSLSMIISQETAKLKGVENFSIMEMEGARNKIAGYLPRLARMQEGKMLSWIKAKLEELLVGQPQDQKPS